MLGAALGITQIIGVLARAPLRPAGGHGLAARSAGYEAAQGEVLVQILAGRRLGDALAAILNGLIGGERDQRLVLALDEGETPTFLRDVARIERACQKLGHTLLVHLAVLVLRPGGLGFEEALYLNLGLETAGRIAFERLGDDGGKRLVAHQKLAVACDLLVAVADRREERPVAVHQPRFHLLNDLAAVLLALQFALRGEDRLDEAAFGRVLELEIQAFDAGLAGV